MTGRALSPRAITATTAASVVLVYLSFVDLDALRIDVAATLPDAPIAIARVLIEPPAIEVEPPVMQPEAVADPPPIAPDPEPEVSPAPEPEPVTEAEAEPVPEPERVTEAEAEPAPEPERVTERDPEPAREPAEESVPDVVELDGAARRRGEKLLEAGRFPHVTARYARISFEDYRDAMLAMGGRFFIFDARRGEPLSAVDPVARRLLSRRDRSHLSPWPRDVTSSSSELLALGREAFGARASHVVLLPPASVDAVLLGGLDRGLRDRGLDPDRLRSVFLVYELVDGRLHCEVQRVRLRGGDEQALRLRINLSG